MCSCKKNSLVLDLFDLAITNAGAYAKFVPARLLKFTQSGGSSLGDYDSSRNAVIVKNVNENEELKLSITGDSQEVAEYNAPIRLVEDYNVDFVNIIKDNILSVNELKIIKQNNGVVDISAFPNGARYLGLNIAGVNDWFDTLTFDALYYRMYLMGSSGSVGTLTGRVGRTAFDKVVSGTKTSFLYLDDSYRANGYELLFQISDTDFEGGPVPVNIATCTVVVNQDGTCTLAY